jgi:ribosomal protein S18 acetylase RimI-like enzyme
LGLSSREALIQDYEDISKLHLQSHDLHVMNRPDLYRANTDYTFDFNYFKTLLDNDKAKVFIVENEEEKIIAYTILKVEEAPIHPNFVSRRILNMNEICVSEQCRGRGIGKLLLEKAKNYAKEVGASSLELRVISFNESAIKFYRSMGMTTQSIKMELDIK